MDFSWHFVQRIYFCIIKSRSCQHSSRVAWQIFLICYTYKYLCLKNHLVYRVSQEESSVFWDVILSVILRKKIWTFVLFRTVSDIWRAAFWIWRAIFSFPPIIMRHCLKHVNRCEASLAVVIVVYWSRYFRRSYDRTLPRISAKLSTRTTRGCSFGYTDCYVLVLWHYGALPHNTRLVMQHFSDTFPNRWIGRGSTINWPPRSPDLTPLDFCYGFGWRVKCTEEKWIHGTNFPIA
jgi:hypothetical protein